MHRGLRAATATLALCASLPAASALAAATPDYAQYRAIYKELVETNTTVITGSCTLAAKQIGARLKAAGYADSDVTLFTLPEFPKDGSLVAILPGTDKTAKPMLLLGHLDVVEAKREDWTRDPFTMIEEGGFFYGRGTSDMKAMVAAWIDAMVRFKTEGYKPKRTIKMALTCGEESGARLNGAQWLAENKPDLIAAAFALNEGGGGRADEQGRVLTQSIQVGEKSNRSFRLETTNPGGHSSIPIPDNAIYELADALVKLRAWHFPVRFNETTRSYFAKAGAVRNDALGRAMVALATDPSDKAAEALVSSDRSFNSMLRTTCVATMLDAGHAENALPQRARAFVNCRIIPGEDGATTLAALQAVIGDAKLTITPVGRMRPVAVPPPLDPKIVKPAEGLVARYFPGAPLIPVMSTGATDATYLAPIGIPTYGVPGFYSDSSGSGAHGLNERMAVKSAETGRDFLYDLVKLYANGK